ncbi:MAG: hypothetical protein KatS3mg068_2630 [Candidatus Sericytochromatia bacterium]|nr:MAG: hypothetical protein KatS3mg068_2630 [Candidatus Sericytochromatia bacterium]
MINQKIFIIKLRLSPNLIICFLFYINNVLFAIGGISSTKLIVPSANVLDKGLTEIDLNYFILRAKNQFDEKGNIINYSYECNSICQKDKISEGGISFRATSGIGYNIEIGIEGGHNTMKSELSNFTFSYIDDLKIGSKWNFLDLKENQFKSSLQIGISYDYETFTPYYEGGFIFSKDWSNFSVDLDLHYFTTKRIQIFEKEVLEQSSWFYGPHAGIGVSYNYDNFLLGLEYHFEEAVTKVRQYEFFSESEYRNLYFSGLANYYKIENQTFHQLFQLPETIQWNNIELPINKIYKKRKYFTSTHILVYGFSYTVSDNMSLSFMIHDTVKGINNDNSKILNVVSTFIIN